MSNDRNRTLTLRADAERLDAKVQIALVIADAIEDTLLAGRGPGEALRCLTLSLPVQHAVERLHRAHVAVRECRREMIEHVREEVVAR